MHPSKKQARLTATPKQVIITMHYFTDVKWVTLLKAPVKKMQSSKGLSLLQCRASRMYPGNPLAQSHAV